MLWLQLLSFLAGDDLVDNLPNLLILLSSAGVLDLFVFACRHGV